MSAPILLQPSGMKKNEQKAKRESEAPVNLKYAREFRDEMNRRFSMHDSRFEIHKSQIEELHAKIDIIRAEFQTGIHQIKLLAEEQNIRNKQAYDGYVHLFEEVQDLRDRLKPECLED
jgi:hypothetical protein